MNYESGKEKSVHDRETCPLPEYRRELVRGQVTVIVTQITRRQEALNLESRGL
jgi:hypothetical protein